MKYFEPYRMYEVTSGEWGSGSDTRSYFFYYGFVACLGIDDVDGIEKALGQKIRDLVDNSRRNAEVEAADKERSARQSSSSVIRPEDRQIRTPLGNNLADAKEDVGFKGPEHREEPVSLPHTIRSVSRSHRTSLWVYDFWIESTSSMILVMQSIERGIPPTEEQKKEINELDRLLDAAHIRRDIIPDLGLAFSPEAPKT